MNNTFSLVWFDNSPKPLAEKLAAGAARYQAKYGQTPNTCLVHPSHLSDTATPTVVAGMTLIARRHIQPNDFHISLEQ